MKSVIQKGSNKMLSNIVFLWWQIKIFIHAKLCDLFNIQQSYKFRIVFNDSFKYKDKIKTTIHPFLSLSDKLNTITFGVRYNNSKEAIEGFCIWSSEHNSGMNRLMSRNNRGYNIVLNEPYILTFSLGEGRPFMKIEREDKNFTSYGRLRADIELTKSLPLLDGPYFIGKAESFIDVNIEML